MGHDGTDAQGRCLHDQRDAQVNDKVDESGNADARHEHLEAVVHGFFCLRNEKITIQKLIVVVNVGAQSPK